MATAADPRVTAIAGTLLSGAQAILGQRLRGLYLFGAVTFLEAASAVGDIDAYGVSDVPLTDTERDEIVDLEARLAEAHGLDIDAYWITAADFRRAEPPLHQLWPVSAVQRDSSWALHREHLRSTHVVVLAGADPADLVPAATWPEIDAALAGEVDFVECWLDRAPAYGVLQLCRILYSQRTHDVVVSKATTAAWARETLPAWDALIAAALRVYPDSGIAVLPAVPLHRFVADLREQIDAVRSATAGTPAAATADAPGTADATATSGGAPPPGPLQR